MSCQWELSTTARVPTPLGQEEGEKHVKQKRTWRVGREQPKVVLWSLSADVVGVGQSEMKIETIEEIMLRRVPSQTFSGCCKDRLYLSFLGNPEAPHYFKDTTCVSNIRKGWTWFHRFSVIQVEKVLRITALIITESRESSFSVLIIVS